MPSTSSGWVDLGKGVLYRRGEDQRKTNKKQPPVAIPDRLLAHLRRWNRLDAELGVRHVVHYQGTRVSKLRRSWATARQAAGLDEDVIPHTLRHTAATWLMQLGVECGRLLGISGCRSRCSKRSTVITTPITKRSIRTAFTRTTPTRIRNVS